MKASKVGIRGVLAVSAKIAAETAGRSHVDVVIEGSRISSVLDAGTADTADARVIDGRDRLLMPGIVNSHTHSPTNVLKGTGDHLSHPAFIWRNQPDTA